MRIGRLGGLVAVAIASSLAGCGEMTDDGVVETSSALTTNPFTLHNYQTGLCMGVAAGTPTIWTKMVTWECDASANQTFHQGGAFADPAYIRIANNVAADRYLAILGSSNNDPVMIDSYYPADWQGWKPIYAGTDLNEHECYQFEAKYAMGKVIGVSGGYAQHGGSIVIWSNFNDQYGHPDQFWCVY
jgi:hypothetical protein